MPKPKQKDDEYFKSVRFNPLADYGAQIEDKKMFKSKAVGETSISDDPRLSLMNIDERKRVYFSEDVANFEHGKLIHSAANRNLIMSLSSSSQKLLLWILFEIRYVNDTVTLEPERMKRLGFIISPGTLRKSIDDLCEKRIIMRVGNEPKKSDYWTFFINPQIMWKGDAKKFYKNVLRVHPEYKDGESEKAGA